MRNRLINAVSAFTLMAVWWYTVSQIIPPKPFFIAGGVFFILATTMIAWFKGFPLVVKRFPVTKNSTHF